MVPRILMHVQHLLGVGHLVRAAALAKALSQDGLEVMLVSGGMLHKALDLGNAAFVQLPALQAKDASYGVLMDATGQPTDDHFRTQRRDMLLAMVQGFDPQMVITEHFPFGRGKLRFELDPLLVELSSRNPRPFLMASVRDVIEPPESKEKEARFLAYANDHYNGILVHGDKDFIPFNRSFPAAGRLIPPVLYTGYVGSPAPLASRPRAGILVSCGNGRTGRRLVETTIQAHKLDDLGEEWEIRLGPGVDDFTHIKHAVEACPRLTAIRARPNFANDLAKAALSISQAGYNTIVDIAAAKTNAILVPYAGHREQEQTLRAEAFAATGGAIVLNEESLSPETLLAAMKNALATHHRPNPKRPFRLGGAQRTVELVREALGASG